MKHGIEEYRFRWRSSFNGDVAVQVGRGDRSIILDWTCRSFTYGAGRFWRCIDDSAWCRLEAALLAARFWCLEPIGDEFGLDGATWTIEGRRRNVYRVIQRWSPGGAVHDLGRTFLDIAGPPVADIDLY